MPATASKRSHKSQAVADRIKEAAESVTPTAALEQLNIMQRERDEEREIAKGLLAIDKELEEAEGQLEGVKGRIKDIESRKEEKYRELRDMALGKREPQLPFTQSPQKNGNAQKPSPLFDQKPAANAWRKVTLESVWRDTGSLPEKATLVFLLKNELVKGRNDAANIQTVGDLSDFTARNKLTDITGIGEGKAAEIDRIMEKWWAKHPELVPKAEEAPKPKDEPKGLPAKPANAEVQVYTLEEAGLTSEDFKDSYAGAELKSKAPKRKSGEYQRGSVTKPLLIKGRHYVNFGVGTSCDTGRVIASLQPLYTTEEWGARGRGVGPEFDYRDDGGLEVETPAGIWIVGPKSERIDVLIVPQKDIFASDIKKGKKGGRGE